MGLLFRMAPFWATATCGLLLLATILAPVTVIRRLNALINCSQGPPERIRKAKGIVVGLFLRSIVAVLCLLVLSFSLALGYRLPLVVDIAIGLLFLSTMLRIAAGTAMSRDMFENLTEEEFLSAIAKGFVKPMSPEEVAKSIDEDVKRLRGE
jgi:hypothetical protein